MYPFSLIIFFRTVVVFQQCFLGNTFVLSVYIMPVLEILSHFNISYAMLKYHIGTWSVDMVRTSLATLTRNSVFNGLSYLSPLIQRSPVTALIL